MVRCHKVSLLGLLGGLLFILMFFFTFQFPIFKLITILLIIIIGYSKKKVFVAKKNANLIITFVFVNLVFTFNAFLNNNPAPIVRIGVDVVWPIIYLFLLSLIGRSFWRYFNTAIKYSLFILILLGIVSTIYFNLFGPIDEGTFICSSSVRPDFPILALSGPCVVTFMIMYFYYFAHIIISKSEFSLFDKSIIILGIVFIFLTSRRALYINFFLFFIILGVINSKVRYKSRMVSKKIRKLFGYLVAFIVFVILLLAYNEILDTKMLQSFLENIYVADNTDPRFEQQKALLDGWYDSFFIGNGPGVNAAVVRSDTIVGAYELSYYAMLFSKGIIGFLFFWIMVFWLCKETLKTYRKDVFYQDSIPVITTLILFLIANSSNPYLDSFDFEWILFLPLVFINNYEKEKCRFINKSI